jgi:hypothetical protein
MPTPGSAGRPLPSSGARSSTTGTSTRDSPIDGRAVVDEATAEHERRRSAAVARALRDLPLHRGLRTERADLWDGVEYEGSREPLVERATFDRVQELLGARAMRGTRERRHHHYLKGLLVCGVRSGVLSCSPIVAD